MTKCSFTGSRWTNYKLKRYKEQVIRYIASFSIFLLTWPNGIEQVSESRPGSPCNLDTTHPHTYHINMDSKEYSIIADTSDSNDSVLIYNMKLTEELVEKLMKGQKDLDNLTGIEFFLFDIWRWKRNWSKIYSVNEKVTTNFIYCRNWKSDRMFFNLRK